MTITFNTGIPAANNNPSLDQPEMLQNNISTDAILAIDHVSFNSSGVAPNGVSGTHLQVTFNGKNTPGAQTDPQSVLYTANGTASTKAEMFFKNGDGTFLVSPIKAFGSFITQAGAGVIGAITSYNVNTITSVGGATSQFIVALTPGAVNGTNVAVFLNLGDNTGSILWTYAANTLTITAPTTTRRVSFAILQV